LPSALPRGQKRSSRARLTSTSAERLAGSRRPKVRPDSSGMPIARKYSGLAKRTSRIGGTASGGSGWSSIVWALFEPPPESGRIVTVPASTTPGTARTRSSRALTKRAVAAEVPYSASGSARPTVRTPRESTPGSTRCSRQKLRTMRPEPTSSTSASAICATTRTFLARCRPWPEEPPRPPSLSAGLSSGEP
jgi:hypothetical protein